MYKIGGVTCAGITYGISAENPNIAYFELPDGYRLVYDINTYEYIGRYNPYLNEVI